MPVRREMPDMCSGPIFSKLLLFALPLMAMDILQLLFNAADTVIIGRFEGTAAMAAVGASGPIVRALVGVYVSLSAGACVAVANAWGAQDGQGAGRALHTAMLISIVGGTVLMIVGIAMCGPMLRLIGTPQEILPLAETYLRIYFLSMPASMVYNFGAACLRGVGDSRHPMVYLTLAGVVNVLLNVLLVAVLRVGVAGVAIATVISQYLAAGLIFRFLRHGDALRLDLRRLRADREKFSFIMRIGLPAVMQTMMFSISNILIQAGVNSFGSGMVAAAAAAQNIQGVLDSVQMSFYNAAVSFTGQNVGARRFERIGGIMRACVVFSFASWIVIGGGTMLLARHLMGIFSADALVIEMGVTRLAVILSLYFFYGFTCIIPGVTRGMGYSVGPMICNVVGVCLIRIICLATIFKAAPSVVTLHLSYPISWIFSGTGQILVCLAARRKLEKSIRTT